MEGFKKKTMLPKSRSQDGFEEREKKNTKMLAKPSLIHSEGSTKV